MIGNEGVVLQRLDDGRIDGVDLADKTDVEEFARFFAVRHLHAARADQAAVLAGQADGLAAVVVDQHDDILLHFAAQHPLHHFHGFFVGDAHALHESALLADFFQRIVDLRSAAVHHDRVHADQLEQDHVAREAVLEALVGHGVAAVFDDDGLAVEIADVGQGLGQNLRLDLRRYGRQVVIHVQVQFSELIHGESGK